MRDALTGLLQANLAASAAIVLVLVLRAPVRRFLGARVGYGLWLLVPLTTAISFAPPRSAALLPAPAMAPAPLTTAAERTASAILQMGEGSSSQVSAGFPAALLEPSLVVAGVWAIGLALMFGWLMLRQLQFMHLLRLGTAGPAVVGVVRPRIVTPTDFETRFEPREQAMVLAHERIHLARQDARINALIALARCICWFNPLIQVAAHLMRVDQELACDAAVVERHPRARAPYAQALLKAQLAARPLPLGCYWPARTEHPLTLRIAMLKRADASLARRLCGSALLTVLATGAGYGAWAAAPATRPTMAAPLRYVEAAMSSEAELPAPTPSKPEALLVTAAPVELAAASVAVDPQPEPRFDPTEVTADGRPRYGRPFAARFDANALVWIRGVVVRVDFLNPNSALWVYGGGIDKDGAKLSEQLWRIDGGTYQTVSPEARAAGLRSVGQEVSVRGYLAKDRACLPTCLVNGREVVLASGQRIMGGVGGKPDCTFEQVLAYTCPGSEKVSPIPVTPTEREIAAALAKSGQAPG